MIYPTPRLKWQQSWFSLPFGAEAECCVQELQDFHYDWQQMESKATTAPSNSQSVTADQWEPRNLATCTRTHTLSLSLSLSSCLCLSINTPKQLLHHQKKRTMGIYLYIFILYIFIYFFIFPKIPAQNKQIIKHTHIHTHTNSHSILLCNIRRLEPWMDGRAMATIVGSGTQRRGLGRQLHTDTPDLEPLCTYTCGHTKKCGPKKK